MAKKKNTDVSVDMLNSLAKATGGEIVSNLKAAKYFVDTGSLPLNFCCSGKFIGGGIPGGRITEIYGPSSSGKSIVATNCLGGVQRMGGIAIYFDCENATNPPWIAKASKVNINELVRYTPPTLEQVFSKMYRVIELVRETYKDKPILIVYDSISVSPCEREFREIQLPENYTQEQFKRIVRGKEQPGERAKICSRELRKLNPFITKHDVSVVFINQIRANVGVQYGNPEVTAGGGNALPFYANLRFRTQATKKIENKKLDTFAGINLKIKNMKNRSFAPFRVVENAKLLFENGIHPTSGLLSCLIQAERIESIGKGIYGVMPAYLPGDKAYTFKVKKDPNDVPLYLLLDCPKLVDANSKEEVEAYLAPFGDFQSIFDNVNLENKELERNEDDVDDDLLDEFDEQFLGRQDD